MKPATKSRMQSGFSLIEVLVSMVVIALGLLGFAGLQAYSVKSNALAMQRSVAAMHAHSIVECMRSNIANIASYDTDVVAPANSIAGTDRTNWATNLAGALPGGTGTINVAAGPVLTITITWNERTSAGEAANRTVSFTTTTQP
jgi:type IV pilus assembly protein PilV